MTHNEKKYPDPMRFMPERFIGADGQLTDDNGEIQYGFGRRCVCRRVMLKYNGHGVVLTRMRMAA